MHILQFAFKVSYFAPTLWCHYWWAYFRLNQKKKDQDQDPLVTIGNSICATVWPSISENSILYSELSTEVLVDWTTV